MIHWISAHPDVLGVKLENFTLGVQPLTEINAKGRGKAPGETNAFTGRKWQQRVHHWFGEPPGDAARQGKIAGDASVMTITSPEMLMRISKMCGQAVRFVVMLRDPVERAISLAAMRYSRRGEPYWANHPSLDAEVEENLAERARHPHKWTGIRADYISNAEYDLLLGPLLTTFRPEQVMLVFTELLRDNAAAILGDVLQFLGLDPGKLARDGTSAIEAVTDLRFNSRDPHVALKPEHRISAAMQKKMCDHFYAHNWRLAVHLNVTTLPWRTCGLGPHQTYTAHGYTGDPAPPAGGAGSPGGLAWVPGAWPQPPLLRLLGFAAAFGVAVVCTCTCCAPRVLALPPGTRGLPGNGTGLAAARKTPPTPTPLVAVRSRIADKYGLDDDPGGGPKAPITDL